MNFKILNQTRKVLETFWVQKNKLKNQYLYSGLYLYLQSEKNSLFSD